MKNNLWHDTCQTCQFTFYACIHVKAVNQLTGKCIDASWKIMKYQTAHIDRFPKWCLVLYKEIYYHKNNRIIENKPRCLSFWKQLKVTNCTNWVLSYKVYYTTSMNMIDWIIWCVLWHDPVFWREGMWEVWAMIKLKLPSLAFRILYLHDFSMEW